MDFLASNPYQAPVELSSTAPQGKIYYTTRISSLSYREIWYLFSNPFEFLLGSLFATLRWRLPEVMAFSFDIQLLAETELPARAKRHFERIATEAVREGFAFAFYYRMSVLGPADCASAVFISPNRQVCLTALYFCFGANQPQEKVRISCSTRLDDDVYLITTDSPPELDPPPEYKLARLIRGSIPQLLQLHNERLAAEPCGKTSWADNEALLASMIEREKKSVQHYLQRGVFTPISAATLAKLQVPIQVAPSPPSSPILAFLRRIFLFLIVIGTGLQLMLPPENARQFWFRASLLVTGLLGWWTILVLQWALRIWKKAR